MAVYAYHAAVLGYTDSEISRFFYKALFTVGMDDWGIPEEDLKKIIDKKENIS